MTEGIYSKKSQRGCGTPRFHSHAGLNITLESNQQTAIRKASFANAITFSEKPLAPGEIFLIEIEETETGWSGHMRIGLTQLNPNTGFELPLYALPDLLSIGPCWLYAITKRVHTIEVLDNRYDNFSSRLSARPTVRAPVPDHEEGDDETEEGFESYPVAGSLTEFSNANDDDTDDENALNTDQQRRASNDVVLRREGDVTWTPCGFVQHRILTGQSVTEGDGAQLPTDVGSRIGVMFVPTGENSADMHFIVNGEDQGPCSHDIPYKDSPVFAVVDVYGSTKRIRTCQIYGGNEIQISQRIPAGIAGNGINHIHKGSKVSKLKC